MKIMLARPVAKEKIHKPLQKNFSRDEAKIALIVLFCIIKIAMCENSTSGSTR
jgi:hypothetical protein